MNVTGIKTSIFTAEDSLLLFIKKYVPSLKENSVVVITSKIVAIGEGRIIAKEDREKILRKEAKQIIKTPWADLTLHAGGWTINGGMDESNANQKIILLPKDSFKTAEDLLVSLKKHYRLRKLGVLITDTRSVPLRVGTIGRAIGYAGFEPIKSYIGKKDLFGRKSRVTQSNQADALAASAVAVMGEGNEQTPIAVIENPPITFVSRKLLQKAKKLFLPPEKDIFSNVYKNVYKKR